MNQKELHVKMLYPVVRVRTEKSGGSGTVIYSKPDPEKPEEYQSFVITCEHVVNDAIKTKRDWDSLIKKTIEKEVLEQVNVEVFDYVYMSKVNSSNSCKASIVAYDKMHDIAILKLDSPKKIEYTTEMVDRNQISEIKLFTPTWTSGCSLGHEPFANPGYVTYLNEIIDNKLYWMSNGASIFGNSGGAVFLAETGKQIGITARISTIQLGFGVDVVTWMGFFVAPQRIYEFFDQQELKFLYDSGDTYKAAMTRRAAKEKEARLMVAKEIDEKEKDESPSAYKI
jgi:hypothetical protein